MKVIVYDKRAGAGVDQWLLSFSWALWAHVLWLFRRIDVVVAGATFAETLKVLAALSKATPITEVQFWGHGSAAYTYLDDDGYEDLSEWEQLPVAPGGLIWFRACSVFQGKAGKAFAEKLAAHRSCRVAGHTRIIGLIQGGLRTVDTGSKANWPDEEGELGGWAPWLWRWDKRSVTCLRASLPRWA